MSRKNIDGLSIQTPEEHASLNDADKADLLAEMGLSASDIEALNNLESLKKQLAEATAERNAARRKLAEAAERASQEPLIIGTADTHPTYIDLVTGGCPAQLLHNLEAQLTRFTESDNPDQKFGFDVVLMPIPLFAAPIQSEKNPTYTMNGKEVPNYELGRTQVRQSLATAYASIGGKRTLVSLSGIGIINVNQVDDGNPDKIADRINNSRTHENFARIAATPRTIEDTTYDEDGDDRSTPAFTPSEQPTQQPTRPDNDDDLDI